jgi:hypothetical protein
LRLNFIISEEVEFLWVVLWSWELWLDVLDEVFVVFTVNHEVEHWLEVTIAHGLEVDVDDMPEIEHDWGVGWIQPLLFLWSHMKGLDGSLNESKLVSYDNLVLVLLGDLLKVVLHGLELIGFDEIAHVGSESNDLWHLVTNVVLHLSELVVLDVEGVPLVVVNVDVEGVVWILSYHLAVLLGGLLELHVGHLDFLHLSHVFSLNSLHLGSWSLLLHSLDEFGESNELLGVDESLGLHLELFTVVRVLHLHLILLALSLKSLSFTLKLHDFLLVDSDSEEFSSLFELVDWRGSGNSGAGGELVHFKKYLLIIIISSY